MKPQSTFGGAKNLTVANIVLSELLPKNSSHHLVIIANLPKAIGYPLFHPETKDRKKPINPVNPVYE